MLLVYARGSWGALREWEKIHVLLIEVFFPAMSYRCSIISQLNLCLLFPEVHRSTGGLDKGVWKNIWVSMGPSCNNIFNIHSGHAEKTIASADHKKDEIYICTPQTCIHNNNFTTEVCRAVLTRYYKKSCKVLSVCQTARRWNLTSMIVRIDAL